MHSWLHCQCPKCGGAARRDADTLDTFVDSSWYFLRYADPHNAAAIAGAEAARKWLPVDLYVGGIEHAILHLLYARFVNQCLFDLVRRRTRAPVLRLTSAGRPLPRRCATHRASRPPPSPSRPCSPRAW